MVGPVDGFDASEVFPVAGPVAPENDDAFTGVIARAPLPIAWMTADRFRQPVLLAEQIDRACLSVVVREDRCPRALFGRKRIVNFADSTRHFLPTELVGEMLGQRTRSEE